MKSILLCLPFICGSQNVARHLHNGDVVNAMAEQISSSVEEVEFMSWEFWWLYLLAWGSFFLALVTFYVFLIRTVLREEVVWKRMLASVSLIFYTILCYRCLLLLQ